MAVSADGDTAIVGGYGDDSTAGAAWVFTRSAGVWSQQGSKLVGTGAAGAAAQGWSVAISADGNAAAAGGPSDDFNAGAAWVFTRSAGVWSQAGGKLAGTGAVGAANQGAVAISADGTTVIAGGSYDDSKAGAAWVFVAPGCTPPAITAQPQGQTIQSGQTATLSVTATGATEVTYQWYQGDGRRHLGAGRRWREHVHHAAPDRKHQLLGQGRQRLRRRRLGRRNDHGRPTRAEAPPQGNVGDGVPGSTSPCEAPGAPVAPSGGMEQRPLLHLRTGRPAAVRGARLAASGRSG